MALAKEHRFFSQCAPLEAEDDIGSIGCAKFEIKLNASLYQQWRDFLTSFSSSHTTVSRLFKLSRDPLIVLIG